MSDTGPAQKGQTMPSCHEEQPGPELAAAVEDALAPLLAEQPDFAAQMDFVAQLDDDTRPVKSMTPQQVKEQSWEVLAEAFGDMLERTEFVVVILDCGKVTATNTYPTLGDAFEAVSELQIPDFSKVQVMPAEPITDSEIDADEEAKGMTDDGWPHL